MKTLKIFTLLLIAGTIGFTSCKKDDDEPTEETTTNETLKTGEISLSSTELYKDDWVYFSFETGTEVSEIDSTNYTTKTNWDIAFHSHVGRTNSGASTKEGKGGIYVVADTDFNNIDKADANNFAVDDSVNIVSGIGIYMPTFKKVSGNAVFADAFDVDDSVHPPLYTPTKKVFVIKTANGKYAKIQITSDHNAESESGHITFKYAYQTDGSTSLK